MKKIFTILSALCIFLALNATAQQRGERISQEDRIKQTVENLKKELTLNADQEKKVTAILTATAKKRSEAFQNANRGDRDAMRATQEKLQKEESAELKKILTDDQFKAYTVYQEKMRKEMEARRNQGGGQRGRRP